jgi:hypothetical protein
VFDQDKLSSDNPLRADIDDVNDAIRNVRALVTDQIKVDDRLDIGLYGMAQCYFQAHVRRALMFLDGGAQAMDAGHGLVTLSCARSLYESVACIHDFSKRLCQMMDKDDVVEAVRFVHQRTYATRFEAKQMNNEEYDYTAVSILKQIDALEKLIPGIRRDYDQLSEAVHPNAQGAHAYFEMSRENGIARFSNAQRNVDLYALFVSSASLLSIFRRVYFDLEVSFLGLMERELGARIQDYETRKALGLAG